jgi:nitrate/nitrite transport system ATP-binding protein
VVRNTMPRSRTRLTLHHDPQYYRIRNHLIDFLVTRSKAIQAQGAASQPIEVAPGLDEIAVTAAVTDAVTPDSPLDKAA